MATLTPADLEMKSRDLRFASAGENNRWWLGGNAIATAFYNALSASFPQGERYFIDAVKRYRNMADSRLQAQIATFVLQESLHTREHIAFNRIAADAGYDFSRIDAYLQGIFRWSRSRSPIEQLASTIALEHFTAILAHELLTDARHLADAPESIRKLWQWHAVEEIEHKAVAFDAFLAATTDYSAFRRWLLRCVVMAITTILFFHEVLFSVGEFLRQDGFRTPRHWLRFFHYIFVKPGIMRRVMGSYLDFYKSGFHPWRRDDRRLIATYEPVISG